MPKQKGKLQKYLVYYRAKALSVTGAGREYHKTDLRVVQASDAKVARIKAKRSGWVITTVRRR